ncbi:glycerol-3-phosphate dehydrogenase [Eubacteriaceae bacterium ES2]|nr:glycerol-3-phosphate dehydrogenase [Eubacteriaceae bacterium ES2]
MSILTFIGAGQMASALTFPATLNGHQIRLVGTHLDRDIIDSIQKKGFHPTLKRQLPEQNITAFQIEAVVDAIAGADAILCGVSSFGLDWFAENILPLIPDSIPVLSVTKGMIDLDDGSMMTYPDYFAAKLPSGKKLSLNAIGGPCTSYELADGDHSTVAFCGKNSDDLKFFKAIFEGPYYHISLSTDVQGVECAVALKNAYALGVSLAVGQAIGADGKGIEHYNSQAALFGQSVKEMRKLLSLIGGKDENIIYGAGDLYVTIFGGRTRRIGTLLGQGYSFDDAMKQLEGVTLESIVIATRTARAVRKLADNQKAKLSDFPLLMHVDELISQNKRVDIPWQLFEDNAI